MTKSRQLVLITVVVIAALFVGSWFLLISPKRSETAKLMGQNVSVQQQTASLQTQLATLKQESAELPKKQAELNRIDKQVPDAVQLPQFLRQLKMIAATSDVELVSVSPGAPVAYTSASTAAATTAATSSTTSTGSVTTTTTSQTPLMTVPVGLQISGEFAQVKQFLASLESLQRIYLVTGFQVSAAYDTSTASAATTVTPGPLNITITGQTYEAGSDATTSSGTTTTATTTATN